MMESAPLRIARARLDESSDSRMDMTPSTIQPKPATITTIVVSVAVEKAWLRRIMTPPKIMSRLEMMLVTRQPVGSSGSKMAVNSLMAAVITK